MEWTVSSSDAGKKLVTFLKDKLGPHYSARQIKRGIENNLCRINQRFEHFASTVLMPGDKVFFEMAEMETAFKTDFVFSPQDIIYQNHQLLIYNKPAGFASDGEEILQAFQNYGGWELLHRLDRETSGLLMFTHGAAFRALMVEAFKTHAVEKVYLAMVDGVPHQPSGVIDNFLGKIHEYEGQTIWGAVSPQEGHHAQTAWELQKKGEQTALLRCYPKTGRTHQIRAHLSQMGHPILGDKIYGRSIRCLYHAPRCLLHASELAFIHPTTKERMHFQAPLPEDFQKAANQLLGGL